MTKNSYLCKDRLHMGRILAIDYGQRRTGIAVTDPLRITPGPLTTLPAKDIIPFLKEYTEKEQVDIIVVGKAMQTNKEAESETMRQIRPFVGKLRHSFPSIEVILHDERYTSLLARRAIFAGGAPKKVRQDKALIDRVSAVIILQSYMESEALKADNRLPQ